MVTRLEPAVRDGVWEGWKTSRLLVSAGVADSVTLLMFVATLTEYTVMAGLKAGASVPGLTASVDSVRSCPVPPPSSLQPASAVKQHSSNNRHLY
jgi:hypothetical protein